MKVLRKTTFLVLVGSLLTLAFNFSNNKAEEYNKQGVAYFLKDLYEQAIASLNKAIEINPDFAEAYNNRALVRFIDLKQRSFEQEEGVVLRLEHLSIIVEKIEKSFKTNEKGEILGPAYVNNNENKLRQITIKDSSSDYQRFIIANYGSIEFNNEKEQLVLRLYDGEIQEINTQDYSEQRRLKFSKNIFYIPAPDQVLKHNNQDHANDKKAILEEVILDYSKAIKIKPDFAVAYNNRGIVYYSKGFYDQAIVDYNKAIEINPEFALAYHNKAIACEKVDQIIEAIEAFENFIQLAQPQYSVQIENDKDKIRELEERESNKMRISAIFIKTKPEAREILQKLKDGADFAELAKQYSIGPGKDKGGDLGYFAPGDMMAELNDVAVNLRVGEHSGIIETSSGFFIIMKTVGITH